MQGQEKDKNMKITDMRIDVVRRELRSTGLESDLGRFAGTVEQGLLRIATDEGVEGHAMVGEFRAGGHALFGPILKTLKPMLVGRDPAEREWLWGRLPALRGRRGLTMAVWAPVDVALWDIAGKAAGMPVHKLLGTHRYECEAYATYPPRQEEPAGYLREAEEIAGAGFRAYKIHPGVMGARDVAETVGLVREAVGDNVRLMLDPNGGYGFRKALEVGRALDANGFYWYEDPVPWYDFDAIAELSHLLEVPLCMSDGPELQFFEAARTVRSQAARSVRGTASKLGITGLKKLCSLAEGFGMNCEIGTAGNSLLNAANINVIMSVSNCDYYEHWMPLAASQFGLAKDITPDDRGIIEAPTLSGLGYELDWDFIESHRVETLE
jgi:L-alanine-DL-glutamate epimerase-like enolase superfamily enzyme